MQLLSSALKGRLGNSSHPRATRLEIHFLRIEDLLDRRAASTEVRVVAAPEIPLFWNS
jgi:hypothetical protein